jgi:hypothetical protein
MLSASGQSLSNASIFGATTGQKTAFELVQSYFKTLADFNDGLINTKPEPVHIYISGPGGTGKSHLIRMIREMIIRSSLKNSTSQSPAVVCFLIADNLSPFNRTHFEQNPCCTGRFKARWIVIPSILYAAMPVGATNGIEGLNTQQKTAFELVQSYFKTLADFNDGLINTKPEPVHIDYPVQ